MDGLLLVICLRYTNLKERYGIMNPDEIRKLRHGLALTREEFGELIGVSRSSVEHYELGTRKPGKPVVMHIERIKKQYIKGDFRI